MHYQKTIQEIFREFITSERGLSVGEARQRLEQCGLNEIRGKEAEPLWQLALRQFSDPLVIILIVAASIKALIGHHIDAWVILAVVLVNGTIGFFQEFKADKAMQALKKLASPKANVVRDDRELRIDAAELVPGDIVVLSAGNKVPADARIFEIRELQVDESMLTGESLPVAKTAGPVPGENVPLAERRNIAFMGTVITHGRSRGVVVATGGMSELGRISKQVEATEKSRTPLQERLAQFTKAIGYIAIALALLVVAIGYFKGLPVVDMALFAISMSVAVIPEGLPIVITVTMAIGLKRMADKNAIVRKLIAVETLGSCDYICSDKTGTITENRMTVTRAWAGGREYEFTGSGYDPAGEVLSDGRKVTEDENLERLLRTGLLCNEAELYREDGAWRIDGDPTEGALIVSARKFGLDTEEDEYRCELLDEVPFSSSRKYMAMLYQCGGGTTLYVKGSPENILRFSGRENDAAMTERYTRMAEQGLRVLGFGVKDMTGARRGEYDLEKEATSGLSFAGFQGIIDPPKASAIEAIRGAHAAGIRVVMITGDNRITAGAIARQVGVLGDDGIAVTGQEIDEKGGEFLAANVERIRVYARVSPHHKLEIVRTLQEKGHTVAVTGDGVNDAPALKQGNIGVSMGRIGTDVAREASDMVLRDDNFASIYEAVKVGRVIFENIQKVSYFLLSSNSGIAISIIVALLAGLPLPFTATQVLWINLVTNGLQDVALAYEPGEPDIGLRPPRDPRQGIIPAGLLLRMLFIGVVLAAGTLWLYWNELSAGESVEYARSTAFNTIVFYQFFQAWNSRSLDKSIFAVPFFSNLFLQLSLLLSVLAQVAVLTLPALQYVFSTVPLSAATWLHTILVSLSVIVVSELDKLLRGRRGKAQGRSQRAEA